MGGGGTVRRGSGKKGKVPDNSMTLHKSCWSLGRRWEEALELLVQVLHPWKQEQLPGMGCWAGRGPAEAALLCPGGLPCSWVLRLICSLLGKGRKVRSHPAQGGP